MTPEAQGILARVRATLTGGSTLDRIDEWLCSNTTLKDEPWSFLHHEFQIQIARDSSRELVVQKCSQVGLSELQVRIMLAYAMIEAMNIIYVLPTARFASKFAKGRIDPVIEGSQTLSAALVKAADSSEMKRLGRSVIYINGAVGSSTAISVPARMLIVDEKNFCNQQVLSQYASRLRHNIDGGFRREFSTPTVTGYGVSETFARSTQNYYLVRCRCGHEFAPNFLEHVLIPGFQDDPTKLRGEDVHLMDEVALDGAALHCPKCRRSVEEQLRDPARRWVAKYPGRTTSGYQVSPFDAPMYNSTPSILRQMAEYRRYADWMNFVLGLPYAGADNQVIDEMVERSTVLPEADTATGAVMGVDVGKTSNVVIARPEHKSLNVIALLRVRLQDGPLLPQLKDIAQRYGVRRVVIDAMPDFSTAQALIDAMPGRAFACTYVADSARKLDYFTLDEEKSVLLTMRTRGFDVLAGEINGGRVRFARCAEMPLMRQHLQGMRRVEEYDEGGELKAKWVKTGDDHYFHALLYAKLAADLLQTPTSSGYTGPTPLSVSGVKLKE